jgi:HD-GYP domain-containing protein (c-di-GMP phosphodiesterase class II)
MLNFRSMKAAVCTLRELINKRLRSASLRFKIALFVVLLLTVTSSIFCVITIHIMDNYLLNEIIKRGESLAKGIALSAGYSRSSSDLLGLDNLVYQAKTAYTDVEYVAIINRQGNIIVHSDMRMSGRMLVAAQGRVINKSESGAIVRELSDVSRTVFEIAYPVVFMGKSLGTVILAINKSILQEAQLKLIGRILIVYAVILVLGVIASTSISTLLIRPIRALSAGVDRLKNGTAKDPLRIYSQDELGDLTSNFNEMSSLIAEQRSKLDKYSHDLEESYVSIVKVVAAAIDARDSYTHGHSARVSQLSLLLGRHIGLNKSELKDMEIACLLHDVGKIKIPDSVLLKPGRLNPSEYFEMQRHVEYGACILDKAPSLRKYIPAVRHHHEWHNGKGYPDALTGDDIPVFASIIGIADAFDAMTTDRPYRKALSKDEALRELLRSSGTQFRTDMVTAFVGLMRPYATNESRISGAA